MTSTARTVEIELTNSQEHLLWITASSMSSVRALVGNEHVPQKGYYNPGRAGGKPAPRRWKHADYIYKLKQLENRNALRIARGARTKD